MSEKNRKNAEMISQMLSTMGFDYEGFCRAMSQEHRTLQQCFTRLCIHWLSTCASEDYQYDERNEASHEVSKALMQSQDADFIGNIPYI